MASQKEWGLSDLRVEEGGGLRNEQVRSQLLLLFYNVVECRIYIWFPICLSTPLPNNCSFLSAFSPSKHSLH